MKLKQPHLLLSLAGVALAKDFDLDKAKADVDVCYAAVGWKSCIQQLHADAQANKDACMSYKGRQRGLCRKKATKRRQNIQKAASQAKQEQEVLNWVLKRAGLRKAGTTCPLLKRNVAAIDFEAYNTVGNQHEGQLIVVIKRGEKKNWYVITKKDQGGVSALTITSDGVNVEEENQGFRIETESENWDRSYQDFETTLETDTPNDITWWYCTPYEGGANVNSVEPDTTTTTEAPTTTTTTAATPATIVQSRVFTSHLTHPVDAVYQPMSNIDKVFADGIDAALTSYLGDRYKGMNLSAGTHYKNDPTYPSTHQCPTAYCPQSYEAEYKLEVTMLEDGHEKLEDMFADSTFMNIYFDNQIIAKLTPDFEAYDAQLDAQNLRIALWHHYFSMRTGDCKCQGDQDRYPSGVYLDSSLCTLPWGVDSRGENVGCEYCSRNHNRVLTGLDATQHTCERPAGIDDLPYPPAVAPDQQPPTPFTATKEVRAVATVWFAPQIEHAMTEIELIEHVDLAFKRAAMSFVGQHWGWNILESIRVEIILHWDNPSQSQSHQTCPGPYCALTFESTYEVIATVCDAAVDTNCDSSFDLQAMIDSYEFSNNKINTLLYTMIEPQINAYDSALTAYIGASFGACKCQSSSISYPPSPYVEMADCVNDVGGYTDGTGCKYCAGIYQLTEVVPGVNECVLMSGP